MKMEKLEIGSHRFSVVHASGELGQAGELSEYYISRADSPEDTPVGEFGFIRFQSGPVGETGINGCHQEDLLAIVIHRLQCFQAGIFACRENALALTKLEEAMHWLNHRTESRRKRGVEGTNTA